jgi:hypothetical protein
MTTEEDFLHRHIDDIAEVMKRRYPVTLVHSPRCTHGKRQWVFTWRWPFVSTWISNAVCICGINEILRNNRKFHNIDDIVDILDSLRDEEEISSEWVFSGGRWCKG